MKRVSFVGSFELQLTRIDKSQWVLGRRQGLLRCGHFPEEPKSGGKKRICLHSAKGRMNTPKAPHPATTAAGYTEPIEEDIPKLVNFPQSFPLI
jgi:hypothetical protein